MGSEEGRGWGRSLGYGLMIYFVVEVVVMISDCGCTCVKLYEMRVLLVS